VDLALAFAVLLLAAAAHAVTGFGYVLLAVPLLAMILDPHTAVAASVLAATLVALGAWGRERHHVDAPSMTRLAVAGLVGVPLGLWVFATVDAAVLLMVIGVVTVATTVLLASRVSLPAGRTTDLAAGLASGVLVTTTGTNGPPLVLALQARALAPRTARATLQALFALQGVVAAAGLALAGQVSRLVLVLLALSVVASLVGWRVGDAVFRRLSAEQLRVVILVVLLVSGCLLLVRGLSAGA
jgi:hypothetical protein